MSVIIIIGTLKLNLKFEVYSLQALPILKHL